MLNGVSTTEHGQMPPVESWLSCRRVLRREITLHNEPATRPTAVAAQIEDLAERQSKTMKWPEDFTMVCSKKSEIPEGKKKCHVHGNSELNSGSSLLEVIIGTALQTAEI